MSVTHISFSEHLTVQMIPEWRKQYVSYEVKPKWEEFFKTCDKELMKVNSFYSEKLTEANRRLVLFGIIALDSSAQEMGGDNYANLHLHAYKPTLRKKSELHKLKTAAGDVYLSLVFLQSYQEINYKALHKIMKKYDAKFECEHGLQWKTERLDASVLHTERNHCGQMMFRLETFMLQLEGGNKQKSMRRLKVPPRVKEQTAWQWITFRIGVTSGLVIALLALIVFKVRSESQMEPLVPLLQLYRGSFLLVEFLYLLGLSIWFWRRSGINHVLIFELDPRRHLSHQHVLEVAGFLAVCWCASMLACLHPSLLSVPQQLHPLFLHSLLLLLLLNPTPTCHSRSCRWLLAVMWKVLTAPFRPVGFAECWLADQLNSLSPLLLSLWDMLCFYTSQINWQDLQAGYFLYRENLDWERQSKVVTCLIQCFPPWLRFTQCLRQYWDSNNTLHLLNAGKYSTVLLMVTFASLYNAARARAAQAVELSVYLYLWAMATCMSVLVTVSWDLRMDWGLLQGNGLLKEELLFSREVYYYAAMLADVLLRISWAINILLAQMKDSAAAASASAVLAPLEVLRRSLWNLFRLENEQLKNCERCRAVRDFDFPVNLPEQFLQEKLMDQDEKQNDHHATSTLKTRVHQTNLPTGSSEMEPGMSP
ncbi:xenotropic and polytropic retrovirus receptor 1 homolog [Astyanax mexicanus]|uniref:xenotropic and polytropic retrovirus receptor 1 homolog n=1 Tax=Astyanax mexicanus TaxID=7994 RepID=UPI0020CB24A2|nr:xenotropic and polytropic retrovirus receptor 1 homolog [Astyanax mexicanus]